MQPPPRPKNPPPLAGKLYKGDTASFTSPSLSAVTHPPSESGEAPAEGPRLHIVRGAYGAGTVLVDVTDKLQQIVQEGGGLTLHAFGYSFKPNGCMNKAFGDPAPGLDKQLLLSYEIAGCSPHLITVPEDKKLKLKMEHMYRKVLGGHPPDEARLIGVEIVKATYGRGNEVYDVTSTLRIMLAEQGGKSLVAFGYKVTPNGCMNKAFGDPSPGVDKILAVEYQWRSATISHAVDEDKKLSISFEKLRPLL